MRNISLMLVWLLVSGTALAQTPTGQLITEDAMVTVHRFDQSTGPATIRLKMDAVAVPLTGAPPSFIERGSTFEFNSAQNGATILVEFKKHWDAPIKVCGPPMTCDRPIKAMDTVIGETTTLFGNGFVSLFAHRIDPGGSLTSSYFTTRGSDHIVLIPLTDLHANFGGTEEDLKPGNAYTSDASEIEVSAGSKAARWIVVRISKQ
ncbi:MAG TPA: hypothetical protein VFU86_11515 [Terriglobales bacterium]|nr:hypothetical protein [Terriglobales bacterium]